MFFKSIYKNSSKKILKNLKDSLYKTRKKIKKNFLNFFKKKHKNKDLFKKIEEQLILSDIGIYTSKKIINNLIKKINKNQYKNYNYIYLQLKKELFNIIKNIDTPINIFNKNLFIILVIGVNGVGKTTTIAKLALFYKNKGKNIMLVSGDTFRAAASDQLKELGKKINVSVFCDKNNMDPASVVFNSINLAKSKNINLLIIDTAGRLHNKINFVNELKKIVNVIKKLNNKSPDEIMLIIDACNGQNSINQTNVFNKEIGITGITVTKLDGTAKGGIIFAISDKFNIPIRFIGIGEKIEDLKKFNSKKFINALLEK